MYFCFKFQKKLPNNSLPEFSGPNQRRIFQFVMAISLNRWRHKKNHPYGSLVTRCLLQTVALPSQCAPDDPSGGDRQLAHQTPQTYACPVWQHQETTNYYTLGAGLFTETLSTPSRAHWSNYMDGGVPTWFKSILDGGFKYLLCSTLVGEMIKFD